MWNSATAANSTEFRAPGDDCLITQQWHNYSAQFFFHSTQKNSPNMHVTKDLLFPASVHALHPWTTSGSYKQFQSNQLPAGQPHGPRWIALTCWCETVCERWQWSNSRKYMRHLAASGELCYASFCFSAYTLTVYSAPELYICYS
jgi:hypothetical protein